ncbi:3-oxoacyl-[acyl-carrier-protein] reductase FabG [subsurface metagenome]
MNAVAPGVIEIPIENKKRLKVKADVAKKTPIGRQGRPEEVAAAVSFLSSDDSSFITGETINVNGGLYMD